MNKDEVDKFCKEYYGYTIDESDKDIGYWMNKHYELQQENNQFKLQLENRTKQYDEMWNKACIIDELRSWLEDWIENEEYCYLATTLKDRCRKDVYKDVLSKLNELEGGKNE